MRRAALLPLIVSFVAGAGLVFPGAHAQTDEEPEPGYIHVIKINGIITGATAELVRSARLSAEGNEAGVIVLELDTPGGLVDATREIVKEELNSKVPVVVYVGPKGARAGSAGVFITLAGHVAAMAPGTNIGAAHPIGIGPPDFVRDGEKKDEDGKDEKRTAKRDGDQKDEDKKDGNPFIFRSDQEHLARKLENDTVAWAEAIAKERGRNVEWARKAVLESVSVTADEALKLNVIDLIAEDRTALFKALDGRNVKMTGGDFTIKTEGMKVIEQVMTTRQQILTFLSNPTILGILGLLMMLGFWVELNNPGLIYPAAIGVLSLVALLVGSQLVSLNVIGFLLIALGFVLFFLEIKFISYGLLTVGGIASIVTGFYLLADKVEFAAPAVDWLLLGPILAATLGIVVFVVWAAARAQLTKRHADLSDMVGHTGEATSDLSPEGKVFLLGTYWTAESSAPVAKGDRVRVTAVDGLRLSVEPASKQSSAMQTSESKPESESE